MFALNLPQAELKISERGGKPVVFDCLRRKFVALTPEEFVRQEFTHYLAGSLGYPAALMGNEIELEASRKRRRCDTVVFSPAGTPLVIIEYKAPTVELTAAVFEQISSYNIILHTPYIMVSNGMVHLCCRVDYDRHKYTFLKEIPRYAELDTQG